MERIGFWLKKQLYSKVLKKDIMELEINKYRKLGAKIGENVRTFSPIKSNETYLIEVGDNATISTGVNFITHDNSSTKIIENSTDLIGRIKIGNNCFIGLNTIIMPGVTLGDNIVVGAGSVVTKTFNERGIIIAGNPAKKIGNIELYKNNYHKYAFNTLNLNYEEKKKIILNNENKLIKK